MAGLIKKRPPNNHAKIRATVNKKEVDLRSAIAEAQTGEGLHWVYDVVLLYLIPKMARFSVTYCITALLFVLLGVLVFAYRFN